MRRAVLSGCELSLILTENTATPHFWEKHTLKHKRVPLNIRKWGFFAVWVTEQWAQVAQRSCRVSILRHIKKPKWVQSWVTSSR